MIDLPTAYRFLKALEVLETSPQFTRYQRYARRCQRDMASPGVSVLEYITPVATLPLNKLCAEEQVWRAVAQDISQYTGQQAARP